VSLTWLGGFSYNATSDEVSFFDSANSRRGERAEGVDLAKDAKVRSKSSSGPSAQGRQADRANIGWGLSAEDQEERFFVRRLAFTIAVAVVAVMGVWLMLTVPSQPGDSGTALSALTQAPGEGPIAYTVLLRTVPESQLEGMKQLIATDRIQALAGENEFHYVPLADGSVAVCVGSFADKDSADLAALLAGFHQMSTGTGVRPFEVAQVRPYRQ